MSGLAAQQPTRGSDERRVPAQPAPLSPAEVAERPALAPGVELSGQMEDSAFEEQPWMIVRNGDFVTISELLYRIAEQADGRRTVADIADRVSKATSRTVSEDNVRHLIAKRLVPLGLVAKADGTVVEVTGGGASRSPLHIGLRTAQVPGHILEPLAQAFKVLFVPPILLGVLAVGLSAVGWVLLIHGVGGGIRGAVYEPWLILVLLPIVIGSAAFHEFGHAAALAYGGGRVRGMGAGIYTAYPVFFTDVTDNYRLKRWSRVRTDLGGFHFNLVFAIAIVGLYLVTGLEFLLLAVLAIVFSIVQQAIPIVRLDGYWALADMTGIPDPLAWIKPFVKSIVPLPAWRDEPVPPMKAWAKAIFVLWMVITVPLLVVLGIFMLATAPRVIGTAIDSFVKHAATLGDAVARGDVLTAVASVVGIGVLLLTSLAFAWFVLKSIKGLLTRLWRWAGGDARRRVAAGAITIAMAGMLLFLWAPALPWLGTPPGPFHDFRPIAAGERLTVPEVFAELVGSRDGVSPGDPAPGRSEPGAAPPGAEVPPVDVPPGPSVDVPGVDVPPVEVPPVDAPPVPSVDVPGVDVPPVPSVEVPALPSPEVPPVPSVEASAVPSAEVPPSAVPSPELPPVDESVVPSSSVVPAEEPSLVP